MLISNKLKNRKPSPPLLTNECSQWKKLWTPLGKKHTSLFGWKLPLPPPFNIVNKGRSFWSYENFIFHENLLSSHENLHLGTLKSAEYWSRVRTFRNSLPFSILGLVPLTQVCLPAPFLVLHYKGSPNPQSSSKVTRSVGSFTYQELGPIRFTSLTWNLCPFSLGSTWFLISLNI